MKSKEELDKKLRDLRIFFNGIQKLKPTIKDLSKYFKNNYVDMFVEGQKIWVDLSFIIGYTRNGDYVRKNFNDEHWQPATITYSRGPIMFFKWDNYPKYKEMYLIKDNEFGWTNWTYLAKVKYSDLFAKKIKKLAKKNPDELYLQMELLEIDDMDGRIEVIKDFDITKQNV